MMNRLLLSLVSILMLSAAAFATGHPAAPRTGSPTALMPVVTILNPDTVFLCQGDTLQLMQTNSVADNGLVWRPEEGFIDPLNTPNPRVVPVNSRYYVVSVVDPADGSVGSDSIWIDVDRLVVPDLVSDTIHCGSQPLQLVATAVTDPGQTLYSWSPGSFLDDSTDVNAVLTYSFDLDTVFTLTATSENGICADTQSVRVQIIPSLLEIAQGDTVLRCLGEGPIQLSVSIQPSISSEVRWFPTTGALTPPTGTTFQVDPGPEVLYYAEATVNGCYQIDSVYVRTDSLPQDMSFTLDPMKDPFCQGDTFYLQSPVYDVGDFPLITHSWDVAPGLASPEDLYNGVFFAADSALVTRINTSGACVDTTTIQINVIKPPVPIFSPMDPLVCPGEPVQITVTFDPSGPNATLEWEDQGNTLSCDDCLNPIATVGQNTTYTITMTAEGSECTSPTMYSIGVIQDVAPTLTDDRLLCLGDSRQLIVNNIIAGYTYRITGGGVDTTNPLAQVTPTTSTTYTVETTGECTTTSQTIRLEIAEDYTLTAEGPGTACSNDPIQLTANVSNGRNGNFLWTLPAGATLAGGSSLTDSQISVNAMASGTYSVTFSDALGCGSTTATVTVEIIGDDLDPAIAATTSGGDDIVPGTDVVFSGNTITLTAINLPAGLNATYAWTGNLSPASGSGPSIQVTVPPPGQNTPAQLVYNLVVTTAEGNCEFPAFIVIDIVESRYEIPELVTPNGDGTNDFFRVFYGGEVTDFTLSIFNRWGQKIFTTTDVDQGWDGTKDGTPQNQDTYLYLAKFRINGTEVSEEGQFSLVR